MKGENMLKKKDFGDAAVVAALRRGHRQRLYFEQIAVFHHKIMNYSGWTVKIALRRYYSTLNLKERKPKTIHRILFYHRDIPQPRATPFWIPHSRETPVCRTVSICFCYSPVTIHQSPFTFWTIWTPVLHSAFMTFHSRNCGLPHLGSRIRWRHPCAEPLKPCLAQRRQGTKNSHSYHEVHEGNEDNTLS